jgi:hypothetical protein
VLLDIVARFGYSSSQRLSSGPIFTPEELKSLSLSSPIRDPQSDDDDWEIVEHSPLAKKEILGGRLRYTGVNTATPVLPSIEANAGVDSSTYSSLEKIFSQASYPMPLREAVEVITNHVEFSTDYSQAKAEILRRSAKQRLGRDLTKDEEMKIVLKASNNKKKTFWEDFEDDDIINDDGK